MCVGSDHKEPENGTWITGILTLAKAPLLVPQMGMGELMNGI